MMVLHQQQQQLQQQLLHHKQHHLPLSQSSYAPSSSHTPAVVNNTPAHSSRRPQQPHHYPQHYHHAPAVTSSSFSQPPQHSWQPQTSSSSAALPPNSRIIQYMQEVAIYAGVEPHATFHPNSSLTQSAPTSQSLALRSSQPAAEMYSNTLPASLPSSSTAADVYYQQQQQSLMERLGKSSASKAASLTRYILLCFYCLFLNLSPRIREKFTYYLMVFKKDISIHDSEVVYSPESVRLYHSLCKQMFFFLKFCTIV